MDHSNQGIGFVVMQQHCQCVMPETLFCHIGRWKVALWGSCHLTLAKNYSILDGNALVIV